MAIISKTGILVSDGISEFLRVCKKSSVLETSHFVSKHDIKGLNFAPKLTSDSFELQAVGKLDLDAPATKFFGVDSLDNLLKLDSQINHVKLNDIMAKSHCYSSRCTNLEHFSSLFFDKPYENGCWKTPREMCTPHFPIGYSGIKMSFTGFKFKGEDASHSIGFIADGKGQLFVLDSLGNATPEMQEFHKKIADIILEREKGVPSGIRRIIFNSKVQQGAEELTCNNWTLANLKAVRDAIDRGEQIATQGALDRILPNDINKILQEQMGLAKTSNYSISL